MTNCELECGIEEADGPQGWVLPLIQARHVSGAITKVYLGHSGLNLTDRTCHASIKRNRTNYRLEQSR